MKEIIYAPILHSSLAPDGLPEDLLFVCPGLGCQAGSFIPHGLPFDAPEAGAVLEELLALGAAFDAGGDLKLMAGQGWLEREDARKRELRAEKSALDEFARTGSAPGGNQWTRAHASSSLGEISQAEQFKNAQKALLLAWEHEKSIIAMRELERKIADGEKRLAAALGDGFNEPAAPAALPPARPGYSWRIVLDAMSAFLPENAALFTAFGPMIDDLRGMGVLEPLPGNMVEEFSGWPEPLVHSLLTATLPMWRFLGYAALPADRPWLGAPRDIFAAPRLESEAV